MHEVDEICLTVLRDYWTNGGHGGFGILLQNKSLAYIVFNRFITDPREHDALDCPIKWSITDEVTPISESLPFRSSFNWSAFKIALSSGTEATT